MRTPLRLAALLLPLLAPPRPAPAGDDVPSLREVFAKDFLVGVGLDGRLPGDYRPEEVALVKAQFAAVTPANSMKMTHLQPEEGRFDFRNADRLVRFAKANGMKVCGHTLLWAKDERTPSWFFRDDDKPATREQLLDRLRAHVRTVAGRYRGEVISWDVVNEALDDGEPLYRKSTWLDVVGPGFIAETFRLAHEADPKAVLVYNDYNVELPAKRAKLLKLLRDLIDQKVPIHAVGIQGHWELGSVPLKEIAATVEAVKELGLKVMITELDVDAIPRARWWADGGKHQKELASHNPYADGCPPYVLERQARDYAALFALFREHADAIDRVTFWDLNDGRSWLNTFPWKRVNHPLLFDREAKPKPAFWSIVGVASPPR